MKKLFIICSTLVFSLCFSQLKFDISKKEAFEKFKNSNVRTNLKISKNEFNKHWNYLKNYKDIVNEEIKVSDLLIFKKISNKENLQKIKNCYNMYPKCNDCQMIIYSTENKINDWKPYIY